MELGKDHWLGGTFTASTFDASALSNARAMAKAQTYAGLAELDYQTYVEIMSDE